MEKQNVVGLIIICTGKYDIFLQPLVDSMEKWFFVGSKFDIYLFSDKDYPVSLTNRMTLYRNAVPHLPFPYPTLFRYKWISKYADVFQSDNLFYLDVDMLFVNEVGSEILPSNNELVVTRHPGFFHGGWGDRDTSPRSTAYLDPVLWKDYFAGGFQGGTRDAFLKASETMDYNIDIDFDNEVMAKWHDESHWNHYIKFYPSIKILSPEYCMVEEMGLRKKWRIDDLTPRLIALKKDHKKLRG